MMIQLCEKIKLSALLVSGHFAAAIEIVYGRALSLESRALIDTGQKTCAPVLRIALGQTTAKCVIHGHESRQILTNRAQTVSDPSTHAWEAHATHTGINLEQG